MRHILKNSILLFEINSIILTNALLFFLTTLQKKTPVISISISLTLFFSQINTDFLHTLPLNKNKKIQTIIAQRIILPSLFLIPVVFQPKKFVTILLISNSLSFFIKPIRREIFSKLDFLKNKILQKDLTLVIKKDLKNIFLLSILSISIYFELFKDSSLETGFLLSLISPLIYYLINFFDKIKKYESLPLTKFEYQKSKLMSFTLITTVLYFFYAKLFEKNYFINTILYLTNSYTLTNITKNWLENLSFKNVSKYLLIIIFLTALKKIIYINPSIYLLIIAILSKLNHQMQK